MVAHVNAQRPSNSFLFSACAAYLSLWIAHLLHDERNDEVRFILRQAPARILERGKHRADEVEGLAERLRVVLEESER